MRAGLCVPVQHNQLLIVPVMGPEPLEWLRVSLTNTATALDTVPLINMYNRESGRGEWRELRRDMGKVHVKQNWQERVAEVQLIRGRQEDKQKGRVTERRGAAA